MRRRRLEARELIVHERFDVLALDVRDLRRHAHAPQVRSEMLGTLHVAGDGARALVLRAERALEGRRERLEVPSSASGGRSAGANEPRAVRARAV